MPGVFFCSDKVAKHCHRFGRLVSILVEGKVSIALGGLCLRLNVGPGIIFNLEARAWGFFSPSTSVQVLLWHVEYFSCGMWDLVTCSGIEPRPVALVV